MRGTGASWSPTPRISRGANRHGLCSAPLPPALRRASLQEARATYQPGQLGEAIVSLLAHPEPVDTRHMVAPRVTVAERLACLRELLRQGSFSFEQAIERADRVTVAVTIYALLELYKQGEVTWRQHEPFGEITVMRAQRAAETTTRQLEVPA